MQRSPAFPYIVPFGVFLALLGLHSVWALPDLTDQILRTVIMALVIGYVAWPVLDFRVRHLWGTLALGAAIFLLWIGPDLIFPGYRHSFLFENAIIGKAATALSDAGRQDAVVLSLRLVRTAVIVPIVEELFWRAWLLRWIIGPNFENIPLGTYRATSFVVVAVLFASEHGIYWDVGLVAGILFNAWMIRTKSLGDLILCHAVANACLSAYVLIAGKWEYWQ